jgi:acylphosphatase
MGGEYPLLRPSYRGSMPDPPDPVARRIRVQGRVQGVFFRDSCRAEAAARGVTGWVSNEPDGSVSVHAEGPHDAVEALVEWCREGPPAARVVRVDVQAVDPAGAGAFEVR